jgi:hypothetical protein
MIIARTISLLVLQFVAILLDVSNPLTIVANQLGMVVGFTIAIAMISLIIQA